ncbi:MAG: caspase family protein, partial [candidate division NC10 bacterium]|nr:caspase family protein [candidate division NC10 bacterium]
MTALLRQPGVASDGRLRRGGSPAGGAAGGTPRATKDALPRVHVLSVGVSDFTDARVPDLQYADDDARSFYQLLTSGPFGPSAKKLLVDREVTRTSFMRELQYVLETSKRGDLVVLFMAMHGVEDPRGSGVYFLPSDAELNNLAGT